MPTLTRWFVKASLLYFVAALLLGLGLAAQGLLDLPPFFRALGPVYFHIFLVGWVTQLIFGVVFWMFPKQSLERPRGNERLAWATFWLLNAGLILRAVAEQFQTLNPSSVFGWLLAFSALAQWAAGLIFASNTWGRVKER
jgi:heme/copper-type cytochrome/quinol oxidase subunit 1